MTIKIFKLITGEEVIAEWLEDEGNHSFKFRNPLRIVTMPNRHNPNDPNPTVGFAPWAQFSDDIDFELASSSIVCIMNPIPEFVAQYNAVFSKVQIPSTKLIMPR